MPRRMEAAEKARIASWFENHTASSRVSISWHVNSRTPDGKYNSNYAYAVTWTPGTLVISGDIGEFTVTHWNAMPTIEKTLEWLDRIEFDYLMGKSSAKKEFDRAETLRDIVGFANDEAVHTMKGTLKDERRYRQEKLKALIEWDTAETIWAVTDPEGDRPILADYLPDEAFYELRSTLKVERRNKPSFYGGEKQEWFVPDGFDLWHKLYLRYQYDVDDRGLAGNMIFHAWGRREIKESLDAELGDGGHESAARLCGELGIDDYYGAECWPYSCRVHFAAIQKWVSLVRPEYVKKKETAVDGDGQRNDDDQRGAAGASPGAGEQHHPLPDGDALSGHRAGEAAVAADAGHQAAEGA